MPTTATTPTTAQAVLAHLQPFGPAVEDDALAFDSDPPETFDPVLRFLHTGVRALLTGRPWYGCNGETGRVIVLNPGQPIPVGITLLCVEGDERWDRIHPAARLDHPRCFAPVSAAGPSHSMPSATRPGEQVRARTELVR